MTKLASTLATLLCCSIPALAFASPPGVEKSVDDLLREATLVFEGKVVDVSYRMSDPSPEHPEARPHTFVTYAVSDVQKGTAPGQQITLRFLGGPIDKDLFLRLPTVPLFDVGDHDVLLVHDNEQSECPLVECSRGRFRFVDGLVVNEHGQRLQRDGSTLIAGPAVKLAAIDSHRMSGFNLERVEQDESGRDPRQTLEEAQQDLDPQRDPTPESFRSFVRGRIDAVHMPDELASARAHREPSANPTRPFKSWSLPGVAVDPNTPDPGAAPIDGTHDDQEPPSSSQHTPRNRSSAATATRPADGTHNADDVVTNAATDLDSSGAHHSQWPMFSLLGAMLVMATAAATLWPRQGQRPRTK